MTDALLGDDAEQPSGSGHQQEQPHQQLHELQQLQQQHHDTQPQALHSPQVQQCEEEQEGAALELAEAHVPLEVHVFGGQVVMSRPWRLTPIDLPTAATDPEIDAEDLCDLETVIASQGEPTEPDDEWDGYGPQIP